MIEQMDRPIPRRSIAERMAEAGADAMPQATLDAVDYWTVRPDEPDDFAACYPAAPTTGWVSRYLDGAIAPQPADDGDGR